MAGFFSSSAAPSPTEHINEKIKIVPMKHSVSQHLLSFYVLYLNSFVFVPSLSQCQSPSLVLFKDGFPSPQQQEDDQSIPGEWDEFDKIQPMHGKQNVLENPRADGGKDVVAQNRIQEANTQSFKVTRLCFLFCFHSS